ncbi:MAG: hypothetical protein IJV50_01390 [Lachnospiraceae bacterium]|nr:hypothetical protein [Lachnospiraceae bacterium]
MAKEENVILLAMSTFPFEMKLNCYHMKTESIECYFNGISQLEAGTKYFLQLLANEGKAVDRIVVIVSDKAKAVVNPKEDDRYKAYKLNRSPNSFYQERILDYIQPVTPLRVDITDALKELEAKTPDLVEKDFLRKDFYKDIEAETFFVDVNELDEFGKPNLLEIVHKVKGTGENKIHLYMDMQGGFRDAAAELNAVIELLQGQDVVLEEKVATRFEFENQFHEIEEVSEQYKPYELVTAMRIFQQYGWGDDLKRYFDSEKDADQNIKDLMQALTDASDSIKLCKVNEFDQAISRVSRYYNELERHRSGKNTLLEIILQDIKEQYGDLLVIDENEQMKNRPLHYVKQIKWCLEKNFIQQALTITESKMTSEYVHCGLVYYYDQDMNESEEDMLQKFEKIYLKKKENERKNLYIMKDVNHFFVRYCVRIWYDRTKRGYFVKINDAEAQAMIQGATMLNLGKYGKKLQKNMRDYSELCNLRNQVAHASEEGTKFWNYMSKRYSDDYNFQHGEDEDIAAKLKRYISSFENLYQYIDKDEVKRIIDLA